MILKELHIKNFRCFLGDNSFSFSENLTLFLGGSGCGKTSFFEAIAWLFNTSINEGEESYISKKKLNELRDGEADEVSVSLLFDHDGQKKVEKSFLFEKTDEDSVKISEFKFRGCDITCSERNSEDGKILMDRCYEQWVQNFTMFRGNHSLNVLTKDYALLALCDNFSDHQSYEELTSYAEYIALHAKVAFKKGFMKDDIISEKVCKLEKQIDKSLAELQEVKSQIYINQNVLSSYDASLKNLEDLEFFSLSYCDIKDIISSKKERLYSYKSQLYELSRENEKSQESLSQDNSISRIEQIQHLSDLVNKIETSLKESEEEKSRLLIQAGNPDESLLTDVHQHIINLMHERENVQNDLNNQISISSALEDKIKGLNSEIDVVVQPIPFLRSLRQVSVTLSKICDAVKRAKEKHLSTILLDIQSSANDYMERLSGEDKCDKIRLIQKPSSTVEVTLYSINGEEEKKPSYIQMFLMYVAVLFAISDFIERSRKKKYPLILDLNFVPMNEEDRINIYNAIDKLNKQCVVICNDFLSPIYELNMDMMNSLSCSAYTLVKDIEHIKGIPSYITTVCHKIK